MIRIYGFLVMTVVLGFVPSQSCAVEYGWTNTFGFQSLPANLSTSMHSNKVVVDGNNLYIAGEYAYTVDLNPTLTGVDSRTSNGGSFDLFLMKQGTDGSYIWTKTIGGAGWERLTSLTVDSYGNLFMAGKHEGAVDFDPSVGVDNQPVAGAYINKTNADGTYAWTKTLEGSAEIKEVIHESSGVITLIGNFTGTVDFDPSVTVDNRVNNSIYQKNIFITKLNANGSYIGTTVIGSTGSYVVAYAASIDAIGDLVLVGSFFGTVDFDPSLAVDSHTSASDPTAFLTYGDIFITKIKSNGAYAWTKTLGNIGADVASSVVIDSQNNIYIGGTYKGVVDFDTGVGMDNRSSLGPNTGIFLLKLDSVGGYLWAQTTEGDQNGKRLSLVLDKQENIYMQGYGAGKSHDIQIGLDLGYQDFFVKYSAAGSYVWSRIWERAYDANFIQKGSVSMSALALDNLGNAFLIGDFFGSYDFNQLDERVDEKKTNLAAGNDAFIMKLTGLDAPDLQKVSDTWTYYTGSQGSIPGIDSSGKFIFKSSDAGTIQYSGGCTSSVSQAALGENTVFFQNLSPGVYDQCYVTVTNALGKVSNALKIPSFQVFDILSASSGGGCLIPSNGQRNILLLLLGAFFIVGSRFVRLYT